ncbi:MAG TPA: S8 family serine peptidase [Candidatus Thalassarchaeaceae archaeon]|nr:MAG TPA: hypothetical protein D7H85_03050 [Candidatus Poseidoniales archaeon]HII48843.1 S8 family serine peptidase [Candidatus Thalassarchaeaceae archaeon]
MNSDEEDVIDSILEQTAPNNLEEHFTSSLANPESIEGELFDSQKGEEGIDSLPKKILDEADIWLMPWWFPPINWLRKPKVILASIMIVLASSLIVLFPEGEIILLGPPQELIDWQEDHELMTGLDSFVGWDGSGVDVCIVDTGIDLAHPDLSKVTLAGWTDVINQEPEPYDDEGHGTSMAGILVADGGLNGIAKGVNLYIAKALSSDGSGDDQTVATAVDWCIQQEVDIISMSLGGTAGLRFFGQSTDESENSVQAALDAGIYVIAAAGNDGGPDDDGDVESPGSIQRVICVGGHDRTGDMWEGSSQGDNNGGFFPPRLPNSDPDMKPEITGGGHEVPVLIIPSSEFSDYVWGWSSGTSAATVYVTGALAITLQGAPNLQPNAIDGGPDAILNVKEALMETASDAPESHDDYEGYGQLDAAALFQSLTGLDPDTPPASAF